MVAPIGSQAELAALGLAHPAEKTDGQTLGQEEFLSLMLTQLKNQDPFKPLESGEFLGQLAQFASVTGLAELQTSFEGLASSLVANQSLQAAQLVGHSVLAESRVAPLGEEGGVTGAVSLPQSSQAVRVVIRDANGELVRQLELGAHDAGLVSFGWDGVTEAGERAAPGRYEVTAYYFDGGEMTGAAALVDATVESVRFGANGLSLRLAGIGDVPFSAVKEIG